MLAETAAAEELFLAFQIFTFEEKVGSCHITESNFLNQRQRWGHNNKY